MYAVSWVRTTRDEDGSALLDIKRGLVLRLNATGSRVLERLQQGESESQIIGGLSQEFHIDPSIIQADLGQFLKSLEELGLICNGQPLRTP